MPGVVKDCSVFINDVREASQTFSKGNFGYPMSGGGLELDLVEAAFLLQCDRLEVVHGKKPMAFNEFFDYASRKVRDFAKLRSPRIPPWDVPQQVPSAVHGLCRIRACRPQYQ